MIAFVFVSAKTSLTISAPFSAASLITVAFPLSIDIIVSRFCLTLRIIGMTLSSCCSELTSAAPGLVDSPPISMTEAPSFTILTHAENASSSDKYFPPSENESGVIFKTPIILGCFKSNLRSPRSRNMIYEI